MFMYLSFAELIVGFQMTTYAFDEDAGTSSQIAVAVNSGSIGAGITATISVTAEDGTATSENRGSMDNVLLLL